MAVCRKCSPIVLLTVAMTVALCFMYHVTLQYILVVDTRNREDTIGVLNSKILSEENTFNRIARHVIFPEQERFESPSTRETIDDVRDYITDSFVASSAGGRAPLQEETVVPTLKRSLGRMAKMDINDISAIRMTLLNDALYELSIKTKDMVLNHTRYQKVVSSSSNEVLCNYYKEEGRLDQFVSAQIWKDTGYYFPEAVTLVTQITLDKLGTLSVLLKHWSGPVSCSLHLSKEDMKILPAFLSRFPIILHRENIDLHLAVKTGMLYPINFLRNLALDNSYTDYVLLMDVDFMPSSGLSEYLTEIIPTLEYLKQEVLVLPAMEFTSYAGIDFPKNKTELMELWALKIVATSEELHWHPSHKPTNYSRWRTATKPYRVDHVEGYEPYIIGRRDTLPRYNVTFMAGFRDKIVQILSVHASGLKFTVIPDHFAVHIPHTRETRPPFYSCSMSVYQDFVNVLISNGKLKNHPIEIKPADEGPKPKRRIVRRIIRRVVRRKIRKTSTVAPSPVAEPVVQ